uniref:TadE family protein n=1 Tax=Solibacter usitatus (strain Ellin6076) TaxID=234267 RepID=Q01PB9_SOLUE
MKSGRRRQSGGNSLIEFTLVGIPIIFVLISIFQMSSGMWLYQTLAFAVREGTRYAIVHGANCSRNGNTYCVTVSGVATVISNAARGLDPSQMTITLTPSQGSAITDTLVNLMNTGTYSTTTWPPSSPPGANAVGQPVTISVSYPFNSGISMFWPGVKPERPHGRFYMPASSTDLIQF